MSTIIDIHVPDIGDFADVPIIELPVSVGDVLAEGDTILVLESDKATLDVPSPHAGRITEIPVGLGDRVREGSLVLRLEAAEASGLSVPTPAAAEAVSEPEPAPAETSSAPQPAPLAAAHPAPEPPAPPAAEPGKPVYASPIVHRYARTLGVAVGAVSGSGPKGRITREDVEAHVKARLTAPSTGAEAAASSGPALEGLPEWPKIDFAKYGPVERQPLTRIARKSGATVARNALVIPHVCNFDTADITDLEAFRKTLNAEAGPQDAKVTMLAFAVMAVVAALKAYPKFNSSLDGEDLIIKNYWHIGFAADTPEGLVVPVIKEADRKGIREIAAEMAEKAGAARAGELKAEEMQGATFTISSLGGVGGTGFTPIINAPEVAILGMARAEVQPVWDGAAFEPRLIQPLSLSWDHRVVDGVAAAQFLAHVAQTLSDFRLLLA